MSLVHLTYFPVGHTVGPHKGLKSRLSVSTLQTAQTHPRLKPKENTIKLPHAKCNGLRFADHTGGPSYSGATPHLLIPHPASSSHMPTRAGQNTWKTPEFQFDLLVTDAICRWRAGTSISDGRWRAAHSVLGKDDIRATTVGAECILLLSTHRDLLLRETMHSALNL